MFVHLHKKTARKGGVVLLFLLWYNHPGKGGEKNAVEP